jgi:hypothetical protein
MTIGEPYLVCPICVGELRDAVVSPTCTVCGNPEAYRDIAQGSPYLCIGCYGARASEAVPLLPARTDK